MFGIEGHTFWKENFFNFPGHKWNLPYYFEFCGSSFWAVNLNMCVEAPAYGNTAYLEMSDTCKYYLEIVEI